MKNKNKNQECKECGEELNFDTHPNWECKNKNKNQDTSINKIIDEFISWLNNGKPRIDKYPTSEIKKAEELKQLLSKRDEEIFNSLISDLDYYDAQPATDEFSKGFEHCCKTFRKEINKIYKEIE